MGRVWVVAALCLLNTSAFCSSVEHHSFGSSFIADELPVAEQPVSENTADPSSQPVGLDFRPLDFSLESTSRTFSLTDGQGSEFQPSFMVTPSKKKPERFHWGRAIGESVQFLTIQHFIMMKTDDRYDAHIRGTVFNHYWSDWGKSLHTYVNSGWDDGDPFLDNYIAHPLQGALTGYIQVQNDPKGRAVEFSNTKQYWYSRLKATAFATAFSVQFELGPFSEMTIEKYGTWGTWQKPGSNKKINGEGQVDLVITPIGALGWMVAEDYLDRKLMRGIENRTGSHFVINSMRCVLNPARTAANILHFKSPWYRASRDGGVH